MPVKSPIQNAVRIRPSARAEHALVPSPRRPSDPASTLPSRRPLQERVRRGRHRQQCGAPGNANERGADKAGAIGNKSRLPARYGQNVWVIALTRQNASFAGHDDGAENWAILASLIETCKLNGIEPQAYLADVLVRLVNLWRNNRRDELLPRTWAATREQQQRAALVVLPLHTPKTKSSQYPKGANASLTIIRRRHDLLRRCRRQ